MTEPQDAGKYQVDNDKTVQGQVIGDNNTVHQQWITQHIHDVKDKAASSTKPQRVWNIPYLRNDYFTGRQEILAELHARFKANHATALSQRHAMSGLGGIGKTQTAVEYAYRYHEEYQAVLWARAESHEALTSSFIEIATLLDLPQKDEKDQTIIVQAVKHWLQDNHGWLLILDNADEPKIVREFLPTKCDGHILLTTRAQALGGLAQRIEVDTFTPELGALFLLRRATIIAADGALDDALQSDREMAMQISEELEGLPLALDQAGAYIEETGCCLQDYQQIYQQRRTQLLKERRGLVDDHPEPVATTWALSFAKVEEKNAAAAELLRFCAFLAPEDITVEMIAQGASYLGPALEPVASDLYKLNQAIEALRAYSLVQCDPSTGALSIHRLVQAVLKDSMNEDLQHEWAKKVVLAVRATLGDIYQFSRPRKTREGWLLRERYLPHLRIVASLIARWDIISDDAAQLLDILAYYLFFALAPNEEITQAFQNALSMWQRIRDPNDFHIANCLCNLAMHYGLQAPSSIEESWLLFEQALAIYEKRLGLRSSETQRVLQNYILCLQTHVFTWGRTDQEKKLKELEARFKEENT